MRIATPAFAADRLRPRRSAGSRASRHLVRVVLAGAALTAAIAPVLTACTRPASAQRAALLDLPDPAPLRERFDQDRGQPRLLLLLSPT